MSYEKIRERYLKNYITDAQLQRFVDLGIITQEQYDALWGDKYRENEAAVNG